MIHSRKPKLLYLPNAIEVWRADLEGERLLLGGEEIVPLISGRISRPIRAARRASARRERERAVNACLPRVDRR